ncbi:hypothetical protein CCHL11_06154 [Colletotrichum chlorophyti]|uniref:Fungal N-terminal domain-containing protein n=1 Tax=Colletotrichum chlorophyti TaxID=708187 RepID=A0A1Q8RT52_9PEZI|nr:hypothetical protein CCHL11_06154 [Colletotrichum chlorophyti]
MDPITVVTATASLAGTVLKASFKVKEIIEAYDDAPQNITDIAEEIQAVQVALRQVEAVVQQDPQAIERLGLEDVFAMAVNGCHATLLSISKEYEELFFRSDWKTKIKVLWKDGEMTRLLGRLDRKKATLTLLTQTLNLRSTQDIKHFLIKGHSTLEVVEQEPERPVPPRLGPRAPSPDSLDQGDLDGALACRKRDSVLSTTEFDFDYDLINTKTYRQALVRYAAASARKTHDSESEDQGSPSSSLEPISEEALGEVADLIDLSSETLTKHTSLSRATTLHPESHGLDFFDAVETETETEDKQNRLVARTHNLNTNSPVPEPTLAVATGQIDQIPEHPLAVPRSKKNKKRLIKYMNAEAKADKSHRRRNHERPPSCGILEPEGLTTPVETLRQASLDYDPVHSSLNAIETTKDVGREGRGRRKCGRKLGYPRATGEKQRGHRGKRLDCEGLPGSVAEILGTNLSCLKVVDDSLRELTLSESGSRRKAKAERKAKA